MISDHSFVENYYLQKFAKWFCLLCSFIMFNVSSGRVKITYRWVFSAEREFFVDVYVNSNLWLFLLLLLKEWFKYRRGFEIHFLLKKNLMISYCKICMLFSLGRGAFVYILKNYAFVYYSVDQNVCQERFNRVSECYFTHPAHSSARSEVFL